MNNIIFAALLLTATAIQAEVIKKDYQGFTVWADCNEHATARFRYNAGHDMGDYPRQDKYSQDASVPLNCQPSSTNTFSTKSIPSAPEYHRGHLVPANHLDYSADAIRESFFMTNILPMTKAVNLGAWGRTERITECYREKSELLILGGAIWGNGKRDRQNDYFVTTHNIRTPEFFWKVIIKGDGETIAWYIPNSTDARTSNLDKYLVKPSQIESRSKIRLPEVPKKWRTKKQKASWPLPDGCNSS